MHDPEKAKARSHTLMLVAVEKKAAGAVEMEKAALAGGTSEQRLDDGVVVEVVASAARE